MRPWVQAIIVASVVLLAFALGYGSTVLLSGNSAASPGGSIPSAPPSATATSTRLPPTATTAATTGLPPSSTASATPAPGPSDTSTLTASPSPSLTPTIPATPTPTPPASPTGTLAPTETSSPTETSTPAATATPTAPPTATFTPTPTATSTSLQVAASGFGQSGTRLGYGFVAANATSDQALENSAFVLTAYDSTGTARASTRGQIVVLLPGQRLGIAGVLDLPPGVTISRIDVQLAPGTSQSAQPLPGFAAQQVSWQQTGAGFTASGTVTSPYYQDATQVQVAALAYDASGAIVGGGSTVLDVVPARGQKAVQVPFVAPGPPARVELYPALSAKSTFR